MNMDESKEACTDGVKYNAVVSAYTETGVMYPIAIKRWWDFMHNSHNVYKWENVMINTAWKRMCAKPRMDR